jgi:hypothetical protein
MNLVHLSEILELLGKSFELLSNLKHLNVRQEGLDMSLGHLDRSLETLRDSLEYLAKQGRTKP